MKGRVLDDLLLLLSEADTVATAVEDLDAGTEVEYDDRRIVLSEDVPFGHKVALDPHASGEKVHKYGEVIGTATTSIEAGEWVHIHNCESTRGRGDQVADQEGSA
ncbi:UxaA family hydrolase [Halopenitus sp. H-Gu1]|uniref:UxaA family hydrolase n=1 Tax=Halopenitus sp. H-Gu1 TaxID=3242697 RepID=UPI00359E356A